MPTNELIAMIGFWRERAALWKRCAQKHRKVHLLGKRFLKKSHDHVSELGRRNESLMVRAEKAGAELAALKKDARELVGLVEKRVVRDAAGNICNRGDRERVLIARILEATKEANDVLDQTRD